jgi:hypothetical protein
MIAELGLDRAVDFSDFTAKDDGVELRHHFAGSELAEFAPLLARGALIRIPF